MNRDKKFWTLLLVFQVFFGLAVFAVTREYYKPEAAPPRSHALTAAPAASAWSRGMTATDVARLTSPGLVETAPSDPAEIYRRAEEFFVARQYAQAAQLYEQLLPFSPDDAEIYNNLGLTLFYLGRSDEALARLDEGVAKDPDHQRIWLTLGYVNAQLGNIEEARAALTRATETGGNASISEAAMEMLAQLP
jgi:tetratricopeptide (TPR) repeat protein